MIKVFISYSHKDQRYCDELVESLVQMKREKLIDVWSDRKLDINDKVHDVIDRELNTVQIFILLVSTNFLNSQYCYEKELAVALRRWQEGTAKIVPVILDDCDWESSPFNDILALPRDGKPIKDFKRRTMAYKDIVEKFRQVMDLYSVVLKIPLIEEKCLREACRQSYPEGFADPIPNQLADVVWQITDLPRGKEERLPKFLGWLVQSVQDTTVRRTIEDWAKSKLPEFPSVLTKIEREQRSRSQAKSEIYLMVRVRSHRQKKKHYSISACLVHDPDVNAREADLPPQWLVGASIDRLTLDKRPEVVVTEENISKEVAKLVTDCCDYYPVTLEDLFVQCFVPIELLHIAIEQDAMIQTGQTAETELPIDQWCKAVVLRSLERQKPNPVYRRVERRWKDHWETIVNPSTPLCLEIMLLESDQDTKICDQLKRPPSNTIGCGFIGLDATTKQHEKLFDVIFGIPGYPVALWLRPENTGANPYTKLSAQLQNICIGDLPDRLSQNRKNPDFDTQHVSLLWDNPYRPFPDIELSSKSA
jgi:hypothetical protein